MGIRIVALAAVMAAMAGAGRADEVTPETVMTAFERGGMLMWVILATSIVGCAFAVERLLVVRRRVQIPRRLMAEMRDAMVAGGVAAGRRVVDGDGSAMGRVMYALLCRSGATRRELETTVDDEASRILYDLRSNMRPIGVLASVVPMIGLLGTVFGLIAAFRAAAELGMDDPRTFAAGLYVALYTTAFGLVVAIPLLLAYHMLRNRADKIMREVEERALAFISAASSQTERSAAQPAPSARRDGADGRADVRADGGKDGSAAGRKPSDPSGDDTVVDEDGAPEAAGKVPSADSDETSVDEK